MSRAPMIPPDPAARGGYLWYMAERVWTADELERLAPVEQDAIFDASVVKDLVTVPPEFVERVRRRATERIGQRDLPGA